MKRIREDFSDDERNQRFKRVAVEGRYRETTELIVQEEENGRVEQLHRT